VTHLSPLNDEHEALGAKLTEFGGWRMPLVYSGIVAEHNTVRQKVGLFDVSHLGKVSVSGPGSEEMLEHVLPGSIAKVGPGRAGYNLVLDENGGVVDDIFVYRLVEGFLVVPNASNCEIVIELLNQAAEGTQVSVTDDRKTWCILALSGPRAREVILPLVPGLETLKVHDVAAFDFEGRKALIARTGYTGEVTYELLVDWDETPAVWERLLEAGAAYGIAPAGLGARDTLRLEMGYPLHGHELSTETNPLEAGLGWVIDWSKDFVGRSALDKVKAEGVSRKLAGLLAKGNKVPRAHHEVFQEDRRVGEITSGNFSPTLGTGIALAYLEPGAAAVGTPAWVDVRGRRLEVEVVKPPFIRK
jgi:aminomethyltransferase